MLIGLVAMLGAAMGVADDNAIKEYPGGWSLYRNSDNCALLRTYAGDTILRVSYFAKEDTARVAIVDKALSGVRDGGDYQFSLLFVNGDTIDKGWGQIKLKGVTLPDLGSGYKFSVAGKTFMADLAKNKLFGLMDGDKVIESLKLDQVETPLIGLEACALAVAG
ncbi:MAG: hypothetical protein V4459_01365 [Pseudomonadota bacterium]